MNNPNIIWFGICLLLGIGAVLTGSTVGSPNGNAMAYTVGLLIGGTVSFGLYRIVVLDKEDKE